MEAHMITQDIIESVKKDHPGKELRLLTLTHKDLSVDFIVTVPDSKQYKTLMKDREKNRDYANNKYVFDCVKYPKKTELNELFSKHPGFQTNVCAKLNSLAGEGAEAIEENGKLTVFHDDETFVFDLEALSFAQYKTFEKMVAEDLDEGFASIVKWAVKGDNVKELCERYPFFPTLLGVKVIELSEVGAKSTIKKL